jgi:hypothetical protein
MYYPEASRLDRKGTRIVGQNKAGIACPPPFFVRLESLKSFPLKTHD